MTPDGCDVVARLHMIQPDGPRSPKFTHRKSSYGVVKAGVTVALDVKAIIILLLHFIMNITSFI